MKLKVTALVPGGDKYVSEKLLQRHLSTVEASDCNLFQSATWTLRVTEGIERPKIESYEGPSSPVASPQEEAVAAQTFQLLQRALNEAWTRALRTSDTQTPGT